MRHVYLDHQSATPVLPEVLAAMQPFFRESFGNPSSLHHHGLFARDALEKARAQIAALIHAESPDEIIFTSDGTEAMNLAVKGAALANRRNGNHLILSATEHPAVLASAQFLETQGFTCTRVKVNAEGMVALADVGAAITDQTILISIHHTNHEIGAIQPLREIGELARDRGILFYVDAEAAAGWLPVDVQHCHASFLSFSPHRFYGPKGVGVLYQNHRARLAPIIQGGDQENGRRAGVENVPAIVGAGLAAEIAQRDLDARRSHCSRLQTRLWDGLHGKISHLKLNGPELGPHRHPANLHISAEFIEGESQLLLCDMHGMAVASGSSCVSKSREISHVLAALGLPPARARASILLSLGADNTDDDVEYFLETFPKIVAKLRALSPTWAEFEKSTNPSRRW